MHKRRQLPLPDERAPISRREKPVPPPPSDEPSGPAPPLPSRPTRPAPPIPKEESVSSDAGQETYDDFEEFENYEDQVVYDDGEVGEVYAEADETDSKPPPPPLGRRLPPPPKMEQTTKKEPEPAKPAAQAYPEETYEVTDEPQDTYDEFDVAAQEEEQFDQETYDEFDVADKEEEHFDEIQDTYDEFEVDTSTPSDVYEPVEDSSMAPPPPPPPPSRPKAEKKPPPPVKNVTTSKAKPPPPANKPAAPVGLDLSAITGGRNQLKKVDKTVLKKQPTVEEKVYPDDNTEFKSVFAKFKQRAYLRSLQNEPDKPTLSVSSAAPPSDFKSKFKMFEKKKETQPPPFKPPDFRSQDNMADNDGQQNLSQHTHRKPSLPPVPFVPGNKAIDQNQDLDKPSHTKTSPTPPFRRVPSPKIPEQSKENESSHFVPVQNDEGWSPTPRQRSPLPPVPVQRRGKSPSPPPLPNNHSRPPLPPPVEDNDPPSPPPPPPPKIESVPHRPVHGYSQVNLPKPPDEVLNGDSPTINDFDDEDQDIYDDAMSNSDPLMGEPYYFKGISRQEGESKLRIVGTDGAFLIRDSTKGGGKQPYTLMVMYKSKMYNLKIRERIDGKYALGEDKVDEMAFMDVKAMVDYHRENEVILVHKAGQYKTCLEYFPKN